LRRPLIRSVVFDLDGVLVDSTCCHEAAFQEVFRPFGIGDFSYQEYAGCRTAEVVESVLRQREVAFTREVVHDLAQRKSKRARELLVETNPVYPDCIAVLRDLAARYTLALASSGSRETVYSFLKINDCAALFSSILTGEDVEQAKPHPEIYQRTFTALGTRPAEAVVVEDAISGILAAKAALAGAVVGVAGTVPARDLTAAGADHVCRVLSEIPVLLHAEYEETPDGD